MSRRSRILALLVVVPVAGCLSGLVRARIFDGLQPIAIDVGGLPTGIQSLSAQACGKCHEAIYEEWKDSPMGQSVTNPIFLADWQHNNFSELCFKCHAPLVEQQPNRLTALTQLQPPQTVGQSNSRFQESLQVEGVTCVSCHVFEGQLWGPQNSGAPTADPDHPDHPFGKLPRIVEPDVCGRCHQFDGPPFTRLERPASDTVAEWKRWKAATNKTDDCVSCHMPEVTRPMAKDAPERKGRRHTFLGGRDIEFLRDGLLVSEARWEGDRIEVAIQNNAGHNFPTGEPARAVEVRLTVRGDAGQESQVDSAWFMRSIELPNLRERSDTSLAPAETRTVAFRVNSVRDARTARLEILYHRAHNLPHVQRELDLPASLMVARDLVAPNLDH